MNIVLGARYKCLITNFEGVAMGYVVYITGCNQVLLAPGLNEKGEVRESSWLDEQRLQRVGDSQIILNNSQSPGFDKAPPKR